MIFIGEGALLWRAVQHTLDQGRPVDLVCGPPAADPSPAARLAVRYLPVADVNTAASQLTSASADHIVWSINNQTIFRRPLLATNLRILNIHHGALPAYRGLPEVALVYAMLRGERHSAASVHEVDEGIDTGPVLATERYPIGPDEPYHVVMRRGLQACHQVFKRCLPLAAPPRSATGTPAASLPTAHSGYFGRNALTNLAQYRDHPRFARATDLGPLASFLPHLAAAVASAEAGCPASQNHGM